MSDQEMLRVLLIGLAIFLLLSAIATGLIAYALNKKRISFESRSIEPDTTEDYELDDVFGDLESDSDTANSKVGENSVVEKDVIKNKNVYYFDEYQYGPEPGIERQTRTDGHPLDEHLGVNETTLDFSQTTCAENDDDRGDN